MDRFDKVFFPVAALVLTIAGGVSMPDLVSGGLAPAIIAALVAAGASLFGGVAKGIGDAQAGNAQNQANNRRAAKLEDIAAMLMDTDTSGLEAHASRTLSRGGNALNAQLAQRGIYDSGAGMSMHQAMTGDVMAQLSQQINQDELQRMLAVMQMYQSGAATPANVPGSAYFWGGLGSGMSGVSGSAAGMIPYADDFFGGGGGGAAAQYAQNPLGYTWGQ